MSAPARARSRFRTLTIPTLGVVAPGIVTPADGLARVGIAGVPPVPHHVQHKVGGGPEAAPKNLRHYLGELFIDGGATIETNTESGQRLAWTTIQPDGDVVVKFATDLEAAAFDRWPEHIREVRNWLEGLRFRLDELVGRIGTVRLAVFAVLPLVASAYAVYGAADRGGSRWSVWLCAAAVALAAALAVGESVLEARPQQVGDRTDPRDDRSLPYRLRESSPYNAVIVAAPAVLAAASGVLQGHVILVIISLVVPALALAGGFGLVLLARHRFLGRIGG